MAQYELCLEWSGIARDFLERACSEHEVPNLRRLAAQYGYHVVPVDTLAEVSTWGRVITYCRGVSPERQRRHLAHELAHIAMRLAGYEHPDDEVAADFIGAAIICPERVFKRTLTATRWDLSGLTAAFGCSYELAARRIADVRSSVVTICDHGRVSTRVQSHWIARPYASRVAPFERAMIDLAMARRAHVYETDLCRAWYLEGEDGWQRVIVVVGLEEFEERAMEKESEPDVIDQPHADWRG